jgi:hypothetical protein
VANRDWAKKYLVVWTSIGECREYTSNWTVHEEIEDALGSYQRLLRRDDTYTASVCVPITSTDYETPSGYKALSVKDVLKAERLLFSDKRDEVK